MKGLYICCALAQFFGTGLAAGSYDVVPFEHMTSPHRVIIGVPADDLLGEGKDSERVLYRRNKIIEIVDQHVERMAETTTNLAIDSIQYSFVTSMEYGFTQLFPRHTIQGANAIDELDEPLPTPAIRLTNIEKNEKMQPDWPILLSEFPDELDRLVNDYERWQSLTNELIPDDKDQVYQIHSKNLISTLNQYEHFIPMFYAPWCHYSQLMLPKFAQTNQYLNELIHKHILLSNRIILGKVNVDEEGEMKMNFNISTYPTLKIIYGNNKKIAKKSTTGYNNELFPTFNFNGDIGTAGDLLSNILTLNAWPKKLKHSNLISIETENEFKEKLEKKKEEEKDDDDDKDKNEKFKMISSSLALSFSIENFLKIIHFTDDKLLKSNQQVNEVNEDDEDMPSYENKRVIVMFMMFPNHYSIPLKSKLTLKFSEQFAGNNIFITSISEKDLKKTLIQLPGDDFNQNNVDSVWQTYQNNYQNNENDQNDHGFVVVAKCEFSSLLFQPIPRTFLTSSSSDNINLMDKKNEEGNFMKWLNAASWPSIAKFDPSAAQGERIQNSHVKNLCLLFGDMNDFMFEEYKSILEQVSNHNIGFAHYLYADYNEQRLQSLLNSVGLDTTSNEPSLIIVSMINAFKPYKLLGNKINLEAVNSLLQQAKSVSSSASDEL